MDSKFTQKLKLKIAKKSETPDVGESAEEARAVAGADSEAARESDGSVCSVVTMGSAPDSHETDPGFWRKRRRQDRGSESDTSVGSASVKKIPATRSGGRGRGRSSTSGPSKNAAEFLKSADPSPSEVSEISSVEGDLTAESVEKRLSCAINMIMHVADRSGKLKGTFQRKLKTAAAAIEGVTRSLLSNSVTEETERLQAINAQ